MRLAVLACEQSQRLPAEQRFGIRPQITRAAVSVASNVAEGWTRESRKEKAHFLSIAHGSLAELHTQLLLCTRLAWLSEPELTEAFALIDETSRMLTALRRRLRGEIE